ncbi:DUF1906 domain-containing protein [Streptomyces sp. NPDC002851]
MNGLTHKRPFIEFIPFVVLTLALLMAAPATAAPPAGTSPSGPSPAGPPPEAEVRTFHGWAFDTCKAPSLDTMRRWRASEYGAVAVYYGGRGRHCRKQPHLSRTWLREVEKMGWGVLPTYVGSQSPCVTAEDKQDVRMGDHPSREGRREGRDAVDRAKAYGIGPGSPLYLDMESYDRRQKGCGPTTLAFIRAWNREVRRHGYLPGFYSSAEAGVRHMEEARKKGVKDLPSVMWFARWRTEPSLYNEPTLAPTAWHPRRRIHQYEGNVREQHGGHTLALDRNLMHAPVARIS